MSEATYYNDSFEGPATEHDDGGFELLPCVGCETLTGMSGGYSGRNWGPLCMRCGNTCHCAKCEQMRADKRLATEVEQKLEGTWKPRPVVHYKPPQKRLRTIRSTTVKSAKP